MLRQEIRPRSSGAEQIRRPGVRRQDVTAVVASSMPKGIRPYGYLAKNTISAIVKKAIVVINRLWPQRAISPIMFNSNKKYVLQPGAWLRICCTYLGCGTLQ